MVTSAPSYLEQLIFLAVAVAVLRRLADKKRRAKTHAPGMKGKDLTIFKYRGNPEPMREKRNKFLDNTR